jgi:hypothetical protein
MRRVERIKQVAETVTMYRTHVRMLRRTADKNRHGQPPRQPRLAYFCSYVAWM